MNRFLTPVGRKVLPVFLATLFVLVSGLAFATMFPKVPLPKLPPAEEYGNIVLRSYAERSDVEPVYFSHWSHRVDYTCRVCHTELGFAFKAGTERMTMEDIKNGLFCGACHDGIIAFGPDELDEKSCARCHGKSALPPQAKFDTLKSRLPAALFGNKIDWGKAIDSGLTSPRNALIGFYRPMALSKELVWTPPIAMVPKVRFPHERHTLWLDCESCHPDIFDVKLQGTQRFSKRETLQGRFCGTCHLRVAFPFDDCTRCHINIMPH